MPTEFKLPELGENVAAGDVMRILVKVGDTIAKDQAVLELETDKATIEVPSSVAGQVKDVRVKAGDNVKVGQSILSVDDGGKEAAPAKAAAPDKTEQAAGANTTEKVPGGDGGLEQHVEGTKRPSSASGRPEPTEGRETAADKSGATSKVVDISRGARAPEPASESEFPPAPAAPSVRRTARELGVDINEVAGTGDGGRISVDDVKAHVKRLVGGGARGTVAAQTPPDLPRSGARARQTI